MPLYCIRPVEHRLEIRAAHQLPSLPAVIRVDGPDNDGLMTMSITQTSIQAPVALIRSFGQHLIEMVEGCQSSFDFPEGVTSKGDVNLVSNGDKTYTIHVRNGSTTLDTNDLEALVKSANVAYHANLLMEHLEQSEEASKPPEDPPEEGEFVKVTNEDLQDSSKGLDLILPNQPQKQ